MIPVPTLQERVEQLTQELEGAKARLAGRNDPLDNESPRFRAALATALRIRDEGRNDVNIPI